MKIFSIALVLTIILGGMFGIYTRTETRSLDGEISVKILNNEFTLSDFRLSKKYDSFSISATAHVNGSSIETLDFRCLDEDFGVTVSGPYGIDPKTTGEFTEMEVTPKGANPKRLFWPVTIEEEKLNTKFDTVFEDIPKSFSVWVSETCLERILKVE